MAQADQVRIGNADRKETGLEVPENLEGSCSISPRGPSVSLGHNDGLGKNFKQLLGFRFNKKRAEVCLLQSSPSPPPYLLLNNGFPSDQIRPSSTSSRSKVLIPVPQGEEGSGFYSTIFLVTDGSYRTIINLKPLTKFIVCQKFKMETLKSTINLLLPECFMVSIDSKDAYYHVPIHPKF